MLVEQADDSLRVRRGKIRREVNAQRVRRIEIRHVLHQHGEHVRQRNVLARVGGSGRYCRGSARSIRLPFAPAPVHRRLRQTVRRRMRGKSAYPRRRG